MDLQEMKKMKKTINEFIKKKNIELLTIQLIIIDDLKPDNKNDIINLYDLINLMTEYKKNKFNIYNNEYKFKKILNLYCDIINYNINIEPIIKNLNDFTGLETLDEIKKYKLN